MKPQHKIGKEILGALAKGDMPQEKRALVAVILSGKPNHHVKGGSSLHGHGSASERYSNTNLEDGWHVDHQSQ